MWLRGKGNLKRKDQQYVEWIRAEQVRQSWKSVIVISGSSHSQAPWGRKFKSHQVVTIDNLLTIFRLPLNMVPRVVRLLP